MASLAAQTYLTPDEYIAWERKAPFKNEYLDGKIIAMSGASRAHNRITVDTATDLNSQLMARECEVFVGDMRVRPGPAKSAYFYPDVLVVRDEPRFEDDTFDTLLNPIVVMEVLSPSTAVYDRGEKFDRYQALISLQEYILISQATIHIERYHRQGTQWNQDTFQSLDALLPLSSIDCAVPLHVIYRRATLEQSE